jgi:CRP/FNR family transcriptional regulator, cyclic AMP receptor protein
LTPVQVKFKKGDLILREKAAPDRLYIIKKGQIKVFRDGGGDGKEIPLAIVNSGEYLGEMSIILDTPHTASAMALTDVEAVYIDKKGIEEQLKQAPQWLVGIARLLIDRLNRTNEVLRRNGIVDERILGAIKAIGEHAKGDFKL